jgi:hypothetical protein
MPRPANAIDFWRGFALVSIFINHIDGNFYSSLTHMNYSISDAAELFVFLAGWAVCIVAGKLPTGAAIRKFLAGAGVIYAAQILVAAAAIAMLAIAAWALRDPALRELSMPKRYSRNRGAPRSDWPPSPTISTISACCRCIWC